MKKTNQKIEGISLMKINKLATDFVIAFTIILVVGLIVTFLYNLLVYRTSMVDGEYSFRLALILGIARSFLRQQDKK
jgi:type IV secretory pathway TrbL component